MSAHENNTDTESETRILTQEAVVEQIGNYIAGILHQRGVFLETQKLGVLGKGHRHKS